MRISLIYTGFISFIILVFVSCGGENAELTDIGYTYFPIEQGRFVSYDVDSIYVDGEADVYDTSYFQVKEQVDSLFTDAEGRSAAILHRYYRADENDTWSLRDVWTVTRTATRAEKYEENIRYVRMAFSVNEDQVWDGNAFNIADEWEYGYANIGASIDIGDQSYTNTVEVLQREETLLTRIEYAKEIYAREIGMVYKQIDTFDTYFPYDTIRIGVKLQMTAFDYGLE